MPDFQYVAREGSGQQVSGLMTATSEQDALKSLAAQSLFPVQIELAETVQQQRRRATRGVRARHLAVFYTQLADLLRSGVPLLRSLELLSRKTTHSTLAHVIQDVCEQVADGATLADAMKHHPRVFSELAVSMVHAGEEGSFLEDVLKRIAEFTDHQEELKARIVGAMVYPIFLIVIGTIIVVGMLLYVVPKMAPIIDRMADRGSLPWATTALLSLSGFIGDYGIWLLALLVAGLFLLVRAANSEEGRLRFDRLRLKLVGFGPIVRSLAIARFCRILGTLLRNGVPILQSLRIAKDATGNRVLSEAIALAGDSIQSGKSLTQPLSRSKQFPEDVVEMIAVGEEANNLEQVLIDIADNMERYTNRKVDLFVRMLEPVMLTVMAVIVLFVVVALLLPIIQSSSVF